MPSVNPDFRPNHLRSVAVFGEVNAELICRLAPEILRLRADGEHVPITVYINSQGGDPRCIDHLHSLLTAKGTSAKNPRVITVAIGSAASAAANLLAIGDYAIAYPKADIHFHGTRLTGSGEITITMEDAGRLAEQLQNRNRATATLLSGRGIERLAFHYARLSEERMRVREKNGPSASETECFASCLLKNLSSNGRKIVKKAIERWKTLRQISASVVAKASKKGNAGVEFEARLLKGIVDFEVRRNQNRNPNWKLGDAGAYQIMADYLLMRDYDVGGLHNKLVKTIMERFSDTFFTEEELAKISAIPNDADPQKNADIALAVARVKEVIKPFCYFGGSIWEMLQEEENPLTPKDAYWLGVVDEVYDSGLPCIRDLLEADPPNEPQLPLVDAPAVSTSPAQEGESAAASTAASE